MKVRRNDNVGQGEQVIARLQLQCMKVSEAKGIVFGLQDYADVLDDKNLRAHLRHARSGLEAADRRLRDLIHNLERLGSVPGE